MKNKQDLSPEESPEVSRREFLRGTAVAGVGAALAASVPGAAMAAEEEVEQVAQTRDKGYQLTSHVKKYYETLEG